MAFLRFNLADNNNNGLKLFQRIMDLRMLRVINARKLLNCIYAFVSIYLYISCKTSETFSVLRFLFFFSKINDREKKL